MQNARTARPSSSGRRVRKAFALLVARTATALSPLAGFHGTALPGLLADQIDPTLLRSLGERLGPVVLVVGSNGKTTTTRLIAGIVERATGSPVVTNRSGANLRQGILTALLADRAAPRVHPAAVLEVDELAFRSVVRDLRPAVVVILNLVRDQLDRYGEIDSVAERWRDDLAALPAGCALVTCADDPRVEALAAGAAQPVFRFGLVSRAADGPAVRTASPLGHPPDTTPCPRCDSTVAFETAADGLGPWRCPACELERRHPDVAVGLGPTDRSGWLCLDLDGPLVRRPSSPALDRVQVRLSGTAGAYDSAAAVLAAITLGVDPRSAVAAIDGATPAFGRLEEVAVDGRRVVLSLAKNPASLAEATVAAATRRPDGLLIGLADRPADGRDVSWIWDAPLDELVEMAPTTLTGSRADDLALRLKYGRGPAGVRRRRATVETTIEGAFDVALRRVRPGGTLMVLGTYTALLGVRAVLERRGLAPALPR